MCGLARLVAGRVRHRLGLFGARHGHPAEGALEFGDFRVALVQSLDLLVLGLCFFVRVRVLREAAALAVGVRDALLGGLVDAADLRENGGDLGGPQEKVVLFFAFPANEVF